MRRLLTIAVVLLALLSAAAMTPPAAAAPGEHIDGSCTGHFPASGNNGTYSACGAEIPGYGAAEPPPDDEDDAPLAQPTGDAEPPPPPICEDRDIALDPYDFEREVLFMKWYGRSDRPGEDAFAVDVYCRDPEIPCDNYEDCEYTRRGWEWRLPGQPGADGTAPQVTAADLVQAAMAEIAGQLDHPTVRTNPGRDQASIVNIPTFFWVENWTGTIRERQCAPDDPTFCITGVLEPSMILRPGEPEAEPVECDGPGVPYEPGTAVDAEQQAAAPEACTYTYSQRTGVDGRPPAWTAQVEVTWDITWTPADVEGTPEVVLDAEVLRQVHEIQAVVTE